MKLSIATTNAIIKVDTKNKFSISFAINQAINKYYMEKLKKEIK